ncbi:MAG: MFS transporter [Clostridia bacterium]|nr:MFS transporter [Clostridia bacterium]
MATNCKRTIRACFVGYVVQAIVNSFVPLLFVTFQSQYGIPLSQITILITFNFALQLLTDFVAAFFIDKIGYRAAALLAHGFSAAGLISLTFLPDLVGNPFVGLLLSVSLYAIGGGLLEVIISPIVEACPNDHKERTMSMLHSFYCWGCVAVAGVSTLFFTFVGIQNWKLLALLWAMVPLVNGIIFIKTPLFPLIAEGEEQFSLGQLFRSKMFWLLMVMMVCAGASEQAVSQWTSAFAEKGLGISKELCDLVGPMLFSVLMGTSRALYGKYGDKLELRKMMGFCALLCVASYLMISLTKSPIWALVGIGICGFSVGVMWPGSFSTAAATMKGGGNAMFAFLALAGDLGCSGGPTFVGLVAGAASDNLKIGILAAVVFPLLMATLVFGRKKEKEAEQSLEA